MARACFLSTFGATIEKHSDEVVPLLYGWLEGSADFDVVWDPGFAKVRELLCAASGRDEEGSLPAPSLDDAEVIERTAGLMLRLCEQGMSGRFRIAFLTPARLRWGPWQIPRADSLTVETNGEHAVIVATLGGRMTKDAKNGAKKPTDKPTASKDKSDKPDKERSPEELARVTGGAGNAPYCSSRNIGSAAPPAGEAAPPAAAPPAKPGA